MLDAKSLIAVSDSLFNSSLTMPINGLRHLSKGDQTGWFIWTGKLKSDVDFFKPHHVEHLLEKYPFLEKYLELPPGNRFQVDDKGYEDTWIDETLLNV